MPALIRSLSLLLGLGTLLLGPAVSAVAQDTPETHGPVYAHALPDAPRSSARSQPPVMMRSQGARAEFVVVYDGFPAEARAAFQRAVDLWADFIVSDEPIRVDAFWTEFDNANTLGAAGPFIVKYDAGNTRPPGIAADVWYPVAVANARAGVDVDPGVVDIEAEFNADFPRWHFGTGRPGPNEFDFTTVVLHELAHGLGFIGALTAEGGTGTLLPTAGERTPFAFDLLARDCQGNAALDDSRYPRPSEALEALLTSRALYVGGAAVENVIGGSPVPLYAPASWNPGSSYSHLDESTFPESNTQSLMTPFFSGGEQVLSPGALTCAILDEIGWELAADCADLVQAQSPVVVDIGGDACAGTNPPDPSEPPPSTPTLETALFPITSINPADPDFRVRLVVPIDQTVLLYVFDPLGRLMRSILRVDVVSGEQGNDLFVDRDGLANGPYFLHVVGNGFTRTLGFAVLN